MTSFKGSIFTHSKWHWQIDWTKWHFPWKPWHPPHGGKDPVPCFTPGTRIFTDAGIVAVEDVQAGDRLLTRDSGMQEVLWVGRRMLSAAELAMQPALAPIFIARGSMGDDLPSQDMMVSPQHRFLVRGPDLSVVFSEPEMLIPATGLKDRPGVFTAVPQAGICYIHLLFARHEIVLSDGMWTESFQPAVRMVSAMDRQVQVEIHTLFPGLSANADTAPKRTAFASARPTLKPREMLAAFEIG